MPLTHCSLVTPYVDINESTLAQIIACCLTAPSNYLNQCATSHQWVSVAFTWEQFIISAQAIILYREFENYTFKSIATFPRSQWVNIGSVSHYQTSPLRNDGGQLDQHCYKTTDAFKTVMCHNLDILFWHMLEEQCCGGSTKENIIISYLTTRHISKYYC